MANQTTQKIPLILCLCLVFFFANSIAVDILLTNQTMKDGDTIVSSDESFELGFFSPGKSHLRYLGIWYRKMANGTVVWVANRENPINSTSGILQIRGAGGLVLLDQENTTIWSTNTSRLSTGDIVAQLLDSGNLIVRNSKAQDPENYIWQSFEHPAHTFLPQMKIGFMDGGRLDLHLTAWKSADDPSLSDYKLGLDSSGLQLIIKQNSVVRARSGIWNGISFNGLTYLKPNPVFTYQFVYTQQEKYYTYELINSSVLTRIIMSSEGVVERYTWNDRASTWTLFLAVPVDYCDTYSLCGAYGSCDITNTPVCGCLKGFEPRKQDEWDRAVWTSGCARRTPLDCEKVDGFNKFSNVKLPDMLNYMMNSSMTLEECRITCLRNCSCMGYANSDVRGGGSGCILWFGDLMDVKQFQADGQDVYIRMAASETVGTKITKKRLSVILSTLISTCAALFCVTLFFLFWKKRCRHSGPRQSTEENQEEDDPMTNQEENDLDLTHFDMDTIAKATNNFSFQNLLGEGGFGPVYKGFLEEQEVAVKRLSKESRQGLNEFKNEVKCIAELQHRNLVKLIGYCIERGEKMLIYEYMPNKSLDYYIFDQTKSKTLDWTMRYHIIHGIARGLLYLHQDSRLRIIHRDLKASNILLDGDMNPRISDFGMARIFGGNETTGNTRRVVGTYGYMAPEYAIDGVFSIKSDVFSYGVLVLEIISGKRNRRFNHPDHQLNLLGHAWRLFKEGRYTEFIDAAYVMESCDLDEVLRSMHIGLLCVQHNPRDRPTMSTVVLMLGGEGRLEEPNEPGFFQERKLIDGETYSIKYESCSANNITDTSIEPR